MASSKSSQTTRNIVIAFLALWSVISLIIIVVWATSPDMKSASQCRAELRALTEKLEGAKVVWAKDRRALEEMVQQGWDNQTTLRGEIGVLTVSLRETNSSLSLCQLENALLNGNITVLEKEIEEYEKIEANLTSEVALQKEQNEWLQLNLTQTFHQFETCGALRSSAESQQKAAESLTKACEITKLYFQKQFQRCKNSDNSSPAKTVGGAPGIYTYYTLALSLCAASLHLLSSCELNTFCMHVQCKNWVLNALFINMQMIRGAVDLHSP